MILGMKKMIFGLVTLALVMGCSSESPTNPEMEEGIANNTYEPEEDEDIRFIRSEMHVDPDFTYLDEFFEFENGMFTKLTYNNSPDPINYRYDTSGKLVEKQDGFVTILYEYDGEGRLVKEDDQSNNYKTLSYSDNQVIIDTYVYGGSTPLRIASTELTLNSDQKVIRQSNLIEKPRDEYQSQECTYDSRGNIIELRFTDSNMGNGDRVIEYEFDDNPNPYYYAYKKLYESTYFLEFNDGIPNFHRWGLSQNNMTRAGITTFQYVYDDLGYPINRIINNTDLEVDLDYYP